ncbi:hypothetical protein [Actinoplanes couchii]|uniref:Integral membrane protein n=1 Tax=Actinoplanes couchii TaxID=403638 RepID=A0ABQ3X5H1_9ACTN|nr:hypothetical protein [Actinoplanes couchii]MDR6325548.1 hypothetical protein [Actinoplanes couchii]GID53752.1 hypothetical protein Aco03nite_021560 [Actinoplanes couchii]
MTVTPPRETGGAVTRSARNRNRRRLNASSSASPENRHTPVNQADPAPARRSGKHAAEEPFAAAGFTDVGFPAPVWDPWTTDPGQAGPPDGRTDPLDGPAFQKHDDDLIFPYDDSPATWNEGTPAGGTGERERAWDAWSRTSTDEEPLPSLDEDPVVPAQSEGGFQDRGRWAHARRTHSVYLRTAVVRCALYLGPLSVAVAAAEPLGRVAWPVTALMLFFGWTAAQGLTSVGVSLAGRGKRSAAARVVAAGFAAMIGLWCALVWVAPEQVLGPDRALAATVGVCGLLTLATVTVALVTRAESSVAGWFTPCWLLAAAAMADAAGLAEAALVPVETMLPAAIVATAVRAFRPAVLTAGRARVPRLTPAEHRRGVAHAVVGAAQAVCVTLLWQGCPAVMPLPVAPLLLAVPLMEGLIGWHTARVDAALDSAESTQQFDRHVRNITAITLAALVPPFAAGCGLLVAAYRLPAGLADLPVAREAVLALAAGTLLSGIFAITFLLAARSRHGIAATLAGIPPLAATALALFAAPAGLLPATVALLAATHLAGLIIVALTAADLRRTP